MGDIVKLTVTSTINSLLNNYFLMKHFTKSILPPGFLGIGRTIKLPSPQRLDHLRSIDKKYDQQILNTSGYLNLRSGFSTSIEKKRTRIYNISDLHLEYYKDSQLLYNNIKHLLPEADVLVLAGDIGYPMGNHEKNYISLLEKFKQKYHDVIIVPGNHEYFQTKDYNRKEIIDKLRKICSLTSTHLLDNDSIQINGINFMGTTLWTRLDPRIEPMINKKSQTFGYIFKDFKSYQDEFENSYQ